ncbi:lipopolysaccharide biosynthesis protein [Erythrobacteraceae bacterium CFH 75059]|uniref:lipopolysaccharide biosynthesis protein n=1 Tax=Qipengyuania thermophila TaxID=2509361 RepID=UPI001022214E|nr:oligosaccharide flippase family protein [Qipengyuania thermophila]TCD06376.1 lipopolysaccharide biosynthesis protein [Erythrobacteraceae bacterium CFH 75059]
MSATAQSDIAALARGGRTNLLGFLLRLLARLPFLFIAGRLYGADALGRFASALVVVELVALLCSLGEKRGLAQRLAESDEPPAHLVADALLLALLLGSGAALFFWWVPQPLFPAGSFTKLDKLVVVAIPAYAMTEIVLAAQAYRFDVATTVRARAIVEPWTISIMAGVLFFVVPEAGLPLAYVLSVLAGLVAALVPFARSYGWPRGWRPRPRALHALTWRALPLAGADVVEWGTRRIDIFILGLFAAPAVVGVYYVAQQVASLPQKLKTSFEPILGPVITRNLKLGDHAAIAAQVRQVGFWIIAAQAGIALALAIPGEAIMGLMGPNFVGGTGALALLLAAEVVASLAVVAEAALVYMARLRNLLLSVATIVFQAGLTVAAIHLIASQDVPATWQGAGAAGALFVALGIASLIKAAMLGRLLGEPVGNWRWPLLWAAGPAAFVGWLATLLPEWAELAFGVPAVLATYGLIIWRWGFGPDDRILFRRSLAAPEPAPSG